MFIHLNCHSHYSFLAGADSIDALVEAARRRHSPALALTDTNGLYGAVAFQQAARKAGIRPIFGVEIDQPETASPLSPQRAVVPDKNVECLHTQRANTESCNPHHQAQGKEARAVLLAKNLKGFGEVCRIITDRQLNPDFLLADRLRSCSDDVIILSPDRYLLDTIARARGGSNLYAELTAFDNRWSAATGKWKNPPSPLYKGEPFYPATRIAERHQKFPPGVARWRLLAFAQQRGLPVAATNRAFFIRPEDWQVHRLLSAIRTNTTIHTLPPGAVAPPDAWLKPEADIARLFSDIPEAIRNTHHIADQCDVSLALGQAKLPPFDLPAGETAAALLRRLSYEGMYRLYSGAALNAARVRLEKELAVIHPLDLESYFLIVWDIVREAAARGIPTVGRGSAANSLVCRVLNITEVDPIRYNLYFERFLSLERSDYPDIDIDFPWNRRDEMLDYVFGKYSHERVALISTHVHFRSRSLIREVGKALGVPVPEIDAFTKTLPHFSGMAELATVRDTVPECRHLPIEDEPYSTIIELSRRIEGFPRHLSIHCGGIVISPSPITDLIPLQKTPKGFAVTQYDMYPVEDMGLLKIDLLAQKGLAVLSDTVRDVQEHYGITIDFGNGTPQILPAPPATGSGQAFKKGETSPSPQPSPRGGEGNILSRHGPVGSSATRVDPVTDPKTRALVKEGRTIGCFYIESPGMRNLLQKLGVETFEMLTAASSIIRPGVSESGMMKAFIERHNGREAIRYLHPKLEPILSETFGVMIYQEDVIKVAHAIAGMSLGEAEGLRKCMSKKRDWEAMENYRERFVTGALANGVTPDIADELWRQMESFAGYAFCKAHSASFARVSYQTAWLKAHYPAEFMAAVLSNRGGFYDTCAYVEEARRLGLTFLPPDVNESENRFTACGTLKIPPDPPATGSGQAFIKGESINMQVRIGLMQVKHLSRNAMNSILEQRRNGPYISLEDFLSRVSIDESEAETLIRCGAMDAVERLHAQMEESPQPPLQGGAFLSCNQNHRTQSKLPQTGSSVTLASRPQMLWQLKLFKKVSVGENGGLFALSHTENVSSRRNLASSMPALEYSAHEKLWAELECLDLTVSEHLLALYGVAVTDSPDGAGSVLTLSGTGLKARKAWPRSITPIIAARDLSRHAGRLVTLVGWMITAKRTRTGKQELMKFMTLEDPTACFEVTLFPKIYRQFGALIHDRGPFIVRGRVEQDGRCCTLTALWLSRI